MTPEQSELILDIKQKAQELWELFPKSEGHEGEVRGANREVTLGMGRLEEAVSWAIKGITA